MSEFAEDDLVREPFQFRHRAALRFWRLLRRPFLRVKRMTRIEMWLVRRAVASQRRLFGWQ